MALLSEPVELRAIWKPADIEAITTTAATTRAMPKMASSVTFQRARRLRRLYRRRSPMLHLPQSFGNARAIRHHRGDKSRQQSKEQCDAKADANDLRREPQARKSSEHIADER